MSIEPTAFINCTRNSLASWVPMILLFTTGLYLWMIVTEPRDMMCIPSPMKCLSTFYSLGHRKGSNETNMENHFSKKGKEMARYLAGLFPLRSRINAAGKIRQFLLNFNNFSRFHDLPRPNYLVHHRILWTFVSCGTLPTRRVEFILRDTSHSKIKLFKI